MGRSDEFIFWMWDESCVEARKCGIWFMVNMCINFEFSCFPANAILDFGGSSMRPSMTKHVLEDVALEGDFLLFIKCRARTDGN
jgi:hypothetical protein